MYKYIIKTPHHNRISMYDKQVAGPLMEEFVFDLPKFNFSPPKITSLLDSTNDLIICKQIDSLNRFHGS